MRLRLILCGLLLNFYPGVARASLGELQAESNVFLKNATDRPDSTSTLGIGPRLRSYGPHVDFKLDAMALVQIANRSAFTGEVFEASWVTTKNYSPTHEWSFGRRNLLWSEMDRTWQMGVFSPRFLWDPLRPTPVGLPGIFYRYKGTNIKWTVYASPISIPERGFPVRTNNGQVSSASPFFVPLYENVIIQDHVVPIRYNVNLPTLSQSVLNPAFMTDLSYQEHFSGFWARGLYGFLPINQVHITADTTGAYNPQTDQAEIQVYPEIIYHHLISAETGIRQHNFSLFGSLTREIPLDPNRNPQFLAPQLENAWIASIGATYKITPLLELSASYLNIHEDPTPANANATDGVQISLPSRFNYKNAWRSSVTWIMNGPFSSSLRWIRDIQYQSDLGTAELVYTSQSPRLPLKVVLGLDLFFSSTEQGFIGQYLGNDRIRGAVRYTF